MAYTPNIPAASDTKAGSQPILQENSTIIDNVFQVDHADFNDPNAGKHNKISLVQQASDAAVGGTIGAAYTKAFDGRTTPYYRFNTTGGAWDSVVCPLLPVKAFVQFDSAGAYIPADAFNITSVNRIGAGNFRVTLANQMANTNCVPICTTNRDTFPSSRQMVNIKIESTTLFTIKTSAALSALLEDANNYYFVVLGF